MTFEIDKPSSDNNAFTFFLKYTALFMISWIASWFFLDFMVAVKLKYLEGILFNNAELLSFLIAVFVIGWFIRNAIGKAWYGTPFKISFDETRSVLLVSVVNRNSGRVKELVIPFSELQIRETSRDGDLFGKQRIFHIYQRANLMTKLNIDMTAWCRHENLAGLLEMLRKPYRGGPAEVTMPDAAESDVLGSFDDFL